MLRSEGADAYRGVFWLGQGLTCIPFRTTKAMVPVPPTALLLRTGAVMGIFSPPCEFLITGAVMLMCWLASLFPGRNRKGP